MNPVQQYTGPPEGNLGLLVIIGLGCLLLFFIYLKGRK